MAEGAAVPPALSWLPAALGAGRRVRDARSLGSDDLWLLDLDCRQVVLKRERPRLGGSEADIAWEHDFLERLSAAGFPAPRPVPLFTGEPRRRVGDRVWAALTYLPGRSLMWEPEPDVSAAGAFLAAYHQAARPIAVDSQRPSATPLDRLAALMPWDRLTVVAGADRARRVANLVDELERGLHAGGFAEVNRIVIHGDFTTDNVLIEGSPPRITGLVDFGAAYLEAWVADIGFGLWRGGRAAPGDTALDLDRVRRFLRGYLERKPVDPGAARLIPILLWARGLQLLARWVERPPAHDLAPLTAVTARTLDRIDWIRTHEADLAGEIAAALA